MIYINDLEKSRQLFEALSSGTRIKIIELLQERESMNMDTLSKALNISNGALTSHVKKLVECGLLNVRLEAIGHGTQKLCSLAESKMVIDLIDKKLMGKYIQMEFNVGQYTKCKVNATCGLCDSDKPLFDFDIPQFFKYPEHFDAELLWFTDGFVQYTFPNPLDEGKIPSEIQISFEIAGEGPFFAKDYPSSIAFYHKNILLGRYDCPGEFAEHKGKFTPEWWPYGQYGQFITISIQKSGTTINGLESSEYTIDDLIKENVEDELIQLKISCEKQENENQKGGVTLFGKNFGDYPQGILMRVFYE